MGLMDKLNQLTNSMNGLADRVTGEANQQFNTANVGSLEGLGNINTDNANGNLSSPGGFLKKTDSSIKLLDTNISNYASTESYCEYLKGFLSELPGFRIVPAEDGLKQQLNNPNIFYAQFNNNINFFILCGTEYNEIQNILQTLISTNATINNVSKVVIGYFNYDQQVLLTAKNGGIELIGINEYMEINSDATASVIPDLNFGTHQNSFKASLGRTLKMVNSGNKPSGVQGNLEGFTQNLENKINNIGASFGFGGNTQNSAIQQNNNFAEQSTSGVSLEKLEGEENNGQ